VDLQVVIVRGKAARGTVDGQPLDRVGPVSAGRKDVVDLGQLCAADARYDAPAQHTFGLLVGVIGLAVRRRDEHRDGQGVQELE
jgi:hypothetical protein